MSKKSVASNNLAPSSQNSQVFDNYDNEELISPLLSDQLKQKLQALSTEDSASAHSFKRNRYVHSVEVLSEDRRKVSILAREQALAVLLTDMATKYEPNLLTLNLFETVVQAMKTARSEPEMCTALQLIVVATTLVEGNTSDPNIEDVFDNVNELREYLPKKISDTENIAEKTALVTSYAVLTYFGNVGGGGYGVEKFVDVLLEISETTSGDKNAPVASAALVGAALLLTLCAPQTVGEIATNWLVAVPTMLRTTSLGPKLAACKFVAVLFERCELEVLQSDEDSVQEIFDELEQIAQMSIARAGKKDKKAQSVLVKSVLKFCTEKLAEKEEGYEEQVSQFIKSSLSKGLGVTNWSALLVVEHLTWVYGPGLHTQLANNPYIRSLLKTEEVKIESNGQPIESINYGDEFKEQPKKKLTAPKQAQQIRKQKLQKVEDMGMIE